MEISRVAAGLATAAVLAGGGTVVADAAINPYIDRGDRLEIAAQSVVPSAGDNRVELLKSHPEVRLKKWGGEADLGIRYDKVKATGRRQLLTDRVEWKGQREEVHAYPLPEAQHMEDGGFEIEVVLNEPPASNAFVFPLENADQFDFLYQPPLSPEEIAAGSERPENVVGSYAVYHKALANHSKGRTNYGTGKAYHIFRPKAVDAKGAEVWATLEFDGTALTVTVPSGFLASAAYPVRVDPTFGYTSIGASFATISGDDIQGLRATPPDTASVDSVSVYTRSFSGTITLKAVIVLMSSRNIVANGVSPASASIDTTPNWRTVNYSSSPAITASVEYCLCHTANTSYRAYFDSLANSNFQDLSNSYASPTNPTDGDTSTNSTRRHSVYATYSLPPPTSTAPDDVHFFF